MTGEINPKDELKQAAKKFEAALNGLEKKISNISPRHDPQLNLFGAPDDFASERKKYESAIKKAGLTISKAMNDIKDIISAEAQKE